MPISYQRNLKVSERKNSKILSVKFRDQGYHWGKSKNKEEQLYETSKSIHSNFIDRRTSGRVPERLW